jgi:hypothetical protein
MEERDCNTDGVVTIEYFVAQPSGDGFEVRDEALARTYHVARGGMPTFRGQPVTNPLTLDRIQAAIDAWVERALIDAVAEELDQAA